MRTGRFSRILLLALSAGPGCATGPRYSIETLIRRAEGTAVPDPGGLGTTRYSRPELRAELRNLCVRWPLPANRVNSSYGRRFNRAHQGLDLKARIGTPVIAVLPGQVIYAGEEVRGYGRIVILKHPRGLHTVYAHCSELKVLPGQAVAGGQVIALSGNTGRTTGPHLHFEIRDGQAGVDPLQLLPGARDLRKSDLCGPGPAPVMTQAPAKGGPDLSAAAAEEETAPPETAASPSPSSEQTTEASSPEPE